MKLYDHQVRGVEIARKEPRFLFAFSMGTGKTMMMLSVCDERPMRTLVLCPRSVINTAWIRDAENFPKIKAVSLWHQDKTKRRAMIAGDWDVGVINYESFKTVMPELRAAGVKRLICDESSKIKNPQTATTKAVVQFARSVPECYLLSGTPAPNNGTEYWPQLVCVHPAWAGASFWGWAYRYFVPVKRRRGAQEYIATWTQRTDTAAEFKDKMRERVWALSKEEYVDLPEKIDRLVEVRLSNEEKEAYRGVEKELKIIAAGERYSVKAEAVLIKARQIAGGMVLVNGEPQIIGQSKLNALFEVLEEAGNEKVVIWAEFTADIDRISDALHAMGKHVGIIDGRTSQNAGWIAKNFQDGNLDYLVCHPAAAGHGITLTAASIAVYYSLSFSSELHLQSRDRIHRIGQTRACVYVYLLAEDTVDWPMLRSLRGKKSRADAITDALRGAVLE